MNVLSELTMIAARPEAGMLAMVLGLGLIALGVMRRGGDA